MRAHHVFMQLLAVIFLTGCGLWHSSAPRLSTSNLVILDIGHYVTDGANIGTGASGGGIEETQFWYTNAQHVARAIQQAGYRCIVTNRGNPPTGAFYTDIPNQVRILHHRKPDVPLGGGKVFRYPSRYAPQFVSSGIISADYGIYKGAGCVVFLHHDSAGHGSNHASILHSPIFGQKLAQCLAHSMNSNIRNGPYAMPSGGTLCITKPRYYDDPAGGWLQTLDTRGIPGAVIEAAQLRNQAQTQWLRDPTNARRYAEAVAHGIIRYMYTR